MTLHDLWGPLVVAVGAYVVVAGYLFFSQSRMIYFPDTPGRAISATPDEVGLAFETLELQTDDGIKLHGWFVPAENSRGTVLFLHGNAGNISHRLGSLQVFHDLGLSTLIFDYRGYGESGGKPTEDGTYRDARAAWRHLTGQRGTPPGRIVIFGRSLGGSIAAWLAGRTNPAGVIVESAFTSVPDLASEFYPWLPVRWLARFRYDTRAHLGSVACPVLIAHSRNDDIIPFSHGEALFASAREPKTFLPMRGGHNDGAWASGQAYVDGLDGFLNEVLSTDGG